MGSETGSDTTSTIKKSPSSKGKKGFWIQMDWRGSVGTHPR